ncbi:hypothetical protein J6590_043695 [Homalodisca vitripennis]|nr:hypothetical protein J6590_043695 [Homalodisca vitripennis]
MKGKLSKPSHKYSLTSPGIEPVTSRLDSRRVTPTLRSRSLVTQSVASGDLYFVVKTG